jgi:hypothetical protein
VTVASWSPLPSKAKNCWRGLAADAEDLFPDGSFDLTDGCPGLGRLPDEGEEGDQGLAQFGVENRGVVWHAHV